MTETTTPTARTALFETLRAARNGYDSADLAHRLAGGLAPIPEPDPAAVHEHAADAYEYLAGAAALAALAHRATALACPDGSPALACAVLAAWPATQSAALHDAAAHLEYVAGNLRLAAAHAMHHDAAPDAPTAEEHRTAQRSHLALARGYLRDALARLALAGRLTPEARQ